ncbi:MAG: hypothetical protein QM820_16490 [Minicystis sp.]
MPSYAITTFGCQMNVHDSERMHEVLRRAGYAEAEPADADVIVLNTCSVREKAEQKLRSEVGRLAKQKRDRRDLVLVVAGCVAQQEGERLIKQMRGIDLVVGPDNIPELPACSTIWRWARRRWSAPSSTRRRRASSRRRAARASRRPTT